MRTLTSNASTKSGTAQGTEPIILLKVEWGGAIGTKWYCERYLVLGTIVAKQSLLEVGSLNSHVRANHVGMMTSMVFKLDDSTGEFKTIYDTIDMERKSAYVYQHFVGNDQSDLTLLFGGSVTGPISWDEGERTINFSVETAYLQDQAGYAPDFANGAGIVSSSLAKGDGTDETCIGKAWPLCFGLNVKQPAVRIKKAPEASVVRQDGNVLLLEDVARCPAGAATVQIDGMLFSGSFSGNSYTISTVNVPQYTNLSFGARVIGDVDEDNPNVAWLSSYSPVVGLAVHFDFGNINTVDPDGAAVTIAHKEVYRVVKQSSTKVWFDRAVTNNLGEFTPLASDTADYASKEPQVGWPSPFQSQGNRSVVAIREDGVITEYRFSFGAGTRLRVTGYPDVYVCNLVNSTVFAVFAMRRGRIELVPSQYYTAAAIGLYGASGYGVTFNIPLDLFSDQGWSGGQLWVTHASVQSSSVASAIEYIINNYTGLTPDAASFAAVSGNAIGAANFALTSVQNAIGVCDKIAFQAGLALLVQGNIVYLRDYAYEPASVMTIAESKVEAGTMKLMLTNYTDLYTKLSASWKRDHTSPDERLTRSLNTDRYGTIEESIDFFMFLVYEHVYKSAFFWLNRGAKIWKKISFDMAMSGLLLEVFDKITLTFADTTLIGVASAKAIVIGVDYNPTTKTMSVECLLPFATATVTTDTYFWLDGLTFGTGSLPDYSHLVGADAVDIQDPSVADKIDEVKTSVPGVISLVSPPTGFDSVVDLYHDGYYDILGNPLQPTQIAVPARVIGDSSAPAGTQVSVDVQGNNFHVKSSSSKPKLVRITSEGPLGTYQFEEWDIDAALAVVGGATGSAREMNFSVGIAVNTLVVLESQNGFYYFFFPVAACT